jgi:hypothetical protein
MVVVRWCEEACGAPVIGGRGHHATGAAETSSDNQAAGTHSRSNHRCYKLPHSCAPLIAV